MTQLEEITAGTTVAVDANILVYAATGKSASCSAFLLRCAAGEIHAVVPLPVVAELLHALMLIEARENGWIAAGNPARQLAEKPEVVRRLVRSERQLRHFLAIGLPLAAALPEDLAVVLHLQRTAGLLTNDALVVAMARRMQCAVLASADSAFLRVKGLLVVGPADLQA